MTPEELLRPRYKVIALFPGSKRKIGEVIHFQDLPGWPTKEYYEDYPHLFKKLAWWEDRKPEDMPEYVKSNDNRAIRPMSELTSVGFRICCIEKWLPATEQEYLEYINQKEG